jgi:hypothetical protein
MLRSLYAVQRILIGHTNSVIFTGKMVWKSPAPLTQPLNYSEVINYHQGVQERTESVSLSIEDA